MHKVPNCANMILDFLGERERLPNQSRNTLPNRAIKSLDMIRFPGFFSDRMMPFFGKNAVIGFPEIRIADRPFLVYDRQ